MQLPVTGAVVATYPRGDEAGPIALSLSDDPRPGNWAIVGRPRCRLVGSEFDFDLLTFDGSLAASEWALTVPLAGMSGDGYAELAISANALSNPFVVPPIESIMVTGSTLDDLGVHVGAPGWSRAWLGIGTESCGGWLVVQYEQGSFALDSLPHLPAGETLDALGLSSRYAGISIYANFASPDVPPPWVSHGFVGAYELTMFVESRAAIANSGR
jgi:hypothetical protein